MQEYLTVLEDNIKNMMELKSSFHTTLERASQKHPNVVSIDEWNKKLAVMLVTGPETHRSRAENQEEDGIGEHHVKEHVEDLSVRDAVALATNYDNTAEPVQIESFTQLLQQPGVIESCDELVALKTVEKQAKEKE